MKKKRVRFAMKIIIASIVGLFLLQIFSSPMSGEIRVEKAFRLLIRFQNGQFTLLEKREIMKVLPLTIHERIKRAEKQADGYFFEVLGDQDKILMRSVFPDPSVSLMEYPDPQDPNKIKSALVTHTDAVFSVLVPVPPSFRRVRFVRLRAAPVTTARQPVPEIMGIFDLQ